MKRFSLRLPDNLHEALKFSAQREHRSLHNQILMILENHAQHLEVRAGELPFTPAEIGEQAPGAPLPAGEPASEEAEQLLIKDGISNQEINLMDLPPQTFAIFGRQNRYFLQILTWNPNSPESQREFRALAEAGYHVRSRF
jgi:hypothetical protein